MSQSEYTPYTLAQLGTAEADVDAIDAHLLAQLQYTLDEIIDQLKARSADGKSLTPVAMQRAFLIFAVGYVRDEVDDAAVRALTALLEIVYSAGRLGIGAESHA